MQGFLCLFSLRNCRQRTGVGEGTGAAVQGQHWQRTAAQELASPYALSSGLGTCGTPIFPLDAIAHSGVGISQKEASWYLSYGKWGQTAFLVKGAVITVGWREQLWWTESWPRVTDKKM